MAVAENTALRRLATELFSRQDISDRPAHGYEPHAVLGGDGSAPLLVVPYANRKAAANTLLRWTDATQPADLARRIAGWAGIRTGTALHSRDKVFVRTISADGVTLHEHLARVLDLPFVSISASFGPPRPNQKPVLRIFDTSGGTHAFAKIGWNSLTRSLVDGEAEFLRTGTSSLRTIAAPSILSSDPWQDRSVAVMPALAGRPPISAPPRPSTVMLEEVAGLSDRYWATVGESPYRAGLEGIAHEDARRALQLVDDRWADVAVPFGHWHGDWTPWNMRHVGDRLIVWDWERNAAHTPVAFDSIHYEFQKRSVEAGNTLDVLLDAVGLASGQMGPLGVLDTALPAMTTLYLIELHRRFGSPIADEPEASRSHRATITSLLRAATAHFSA